MLSVWLPMATVDTADAFKARVADWPEARNTHLWDAERKVADAFARRLGVTAPAWDVFLAYERGVRWTEEAPPAPTVWLHQLRAQTGAPEGLRFDAGKFEAEVRRLLDAPATAAPKATTSPATR